MKLSKTLAERIHGHMAQNKHISYRFHLNAKAGFKSDKKTVNVRLMNDIIKWSERYGVKIDVEGNYNHVFGYTFIVRDYKAIELLANACKGQFFWNKTSLSIEF